MSSIKHNRIQADAELAELRHEFGVEHRMYMKCKHEHAQLRAALTALISGDVGRQTLEKLAAGQGTDTDDGRAWIRAAEMVRPND